MMACEIAGLFNKGVGKRKWGEEQKGKFSRVNFKLCMFLNTFKGLGVILDCKEIEHKEALFWQDD